MKLFYVVMPGAYDIGGARKKSTFREHRADRAYIMHENGHDDYEHAILVLDNVTEQDDGPPLLIELVAMYNVREWTSVFVKENILLNTDGLNDETTDFTS